MEGFSTRTFGGEPKQKLEQFAVSYVKDGKILIVTWELPVSGQPREMMPVPEIRSYRLISLVQLVQPNSCKTVMTFKHIGYEKGNG